MNNSNGYTSVSSWRDEVSKSLGGLEKGLENIEEKIDQIGNTQKENVDRIERLEEAEYNRKPVSRKLNALWAGLIVLVSAIANIVFKVFN